MIKVGPHGKDDDDTPTSADVVVRLPLRIDADSTINEMYCYGITSRDIESVIAEFEALKEILDKNTANKNGCRYTIRGAEVSHGEY